MPFEEVVEKLVQVPVQRTRKVREEVKVPYHTTRVVDKPIPYPVEKIEKVEVPYKVHRVCANAFPPTFFVSHMRIFYSLFAFLSCIQRSSFSKKVCRLMSYFSKEFARKPFFYFSEMTFGEIVFGILVLSLSMWKYQSPTM